jgi:hypothetical protein
LGARGTLSSFRPASWGRRLPLRAFTSLPAQTRFSHAFLPPLQIETIVSLSSSRHFSSPAAIGQSSGWAPARVLQAVASAARPTGRD